MKWLVDNMKWVMLVSGALTMTMLYTAIAPETALQSTFGQTLTGPVAEVVVRSWGVLIALVGAMLVYGAFVPVVRPLVLVVAAVSKLTFAVMVLLQGEHFFRQQVGVAVAFDLAMVLLFAWYLFAIRSAGRR